MLDLADVPAADLVVELGAGTGVQTGEILARLGPDARLVAVRSTRQLSALLEERYDDPRLQVVCDSAENLDAYLGGQPGRRPRLGPALHLPGRPSCGGGSSTRCPGLWPHGRNGADPVLAAAAGGLRRRFPLSAPADLAVERAPGVPVRLLAGRARLTSRPSWLTPCGPGSPSIVSSGSRGDQVAEPGRSAPGTPAVSPVAVLAAGTPLNL